MWIANPIAVASLRLDFPGPFARSDILFHTSYVNAFFAGAMLLDIWVIFATGLVLVLTLASAGFLIWRGRSAGKTRAELESRCEAARVALEEGAKLLAARAATRDWKQELTARLEVLDTEAAATSELTPTATIRRLILRAELVGEAINLEPHLNQVAGADSAKSDLEALKATNIALETELASLRSQRETPASDSAGNPPINIARERELKSLVQQFTRDSREMLTCIQALESENQALRGSIGAKKTAA